MPSYLTSLRGLQSNNGFANNTCASVSPSLTSAAMVLWVRKTLEDFVPSTRMNVWNQKVKMPECTNHLMASYIVINTAQTKQWWLLEILSTTQVGVSPTWICLLIYLKIRIGSLKLSFYCTLNLSKEMRKWHWYWSSFVPGYCKNMVEQHHFPSFSNVRLNTIVSKYKP